MFTNGRCCLYNTLKIWWLKDHNMLLLKPYYVWSPGYRDVAKIATVYVA